MLYLESFIHRVRLAEVVSHWIVNQPRPGDVRELKRIVNFNSYIARIWLDELATELLTRLHGQSPRSFRAKTKGELKDFIVGNAAQTNPRIEQLFAHYRRFPEDYYRDTPFDGRVYFFETGEHKQYAGSTRIKRFRRIAEKGGRRIVDYLFERIRANADALAEERARALGIPKHDLVTPPAQQVEEFLHAERRLLKVIRRGTIQHEFPILSIPDVVGIKILAEGEQYARLISTLEEMPSCSLLEQEHHTGRYNAINLRVAFQLPRQLLLDSAPDARQQQIFRHRGLDGDTLLSQYREFLETGEDHVLLEIIVCSYPEFLESEIGRSMHEERIVQQRSNAEYSGHLATNTMYLMDYILTLCLAPAKEEVADVPVKLWVKYMPDTVELLHRRLFDLPIVASFDAPEEETNAGQAAPRRETASGQERRARDTGERERKTTAEIPSL